MNPFKDSFLLEKGKGYFKLPHLYTRYKLKLELKPLEIVVLELLFITQRDSFGYCKATLADDLGVSLSSVEKAIKKLIDKKIISVISGGKHKINRYDFSPLIIKLEQLMQNSSSVVSTPQLEEVKVLSDTMSENKIEYEIAPENLAMLEEMASNSTFAGKWFDRGQQIKEYQQEIANIWSNMEKEASMTKISIQAAKDEEKKIEWNEYFEKELNKALYANYRHLSPEGETPLEKAKWCLVEDYKDRKAASLHLVKDAACDSAKPNEFDKLLHENQIQEFELLSDNVSVNDDNWIITVYVGGDIPIEMSLLEYTGMTTEEFNLFKEVYARSKHEQSHAHQVAL